MDPDKTLANLDKREARHYRSLTKLIRDCKDSIDEQIEKSEEKLEAKIQPIHDYMIGQQGFDRARQSSADSTLGLSDKAWEVVRWLALAVVLLVGGREFL